MATPTPINIDNEVTRALNCCAPEAGRAIRVLIGLLAQIADGAPLPPPTVDTASISFINVNATGDTGAGLQSVSFLNVGTVDALVNGQILPAGKGISFAAYLDPVTSKFMRLPNIPYDSSAVGGRLLISWVE